MKNYVLSIIFATLAVFAHSVSTAFASDSHQAVKIIETHGYFTGYDEYMNASQKKYVTEQVTYCSSDQVGWKNWHNVPSCLAIMKAIASSKDVWTPVDYVLQTTENLKSGEKYKIQKSAGLKKSKKKSIYGGVTSTSYGISGPEDCDPGYQPDGNHDLATCVKIQ